MTGLTYSDDKNSDEVCTEELENQFNSSSNNLCKNHFTPTGMPADSSGPALLNHCSFLFHAYNITFKFNILITI